MADNSDKRKYRAKAESPGREMKTGNAPGTSKQDMEFGEAMEEDMNRYSRDMARGRTVDENWKNRARYDGNKNLEMGQDLTFTDKMYTPAVKRPENAERGGEDSKGNEFGEDNTYFWNNDDNRSIEKNSQNRSGDKGSKNKKDERR